ncbi:MAG: hypothetical protein ACE5JS_00200 [Nitrospinota bacterium]
MIKWSKDILRRYREAKQVETGRIRQLIAEHSDEIYHDPDTHVGGNPQGDITIAEFFDYR